MGHLGIQLDMQNAGRLPPEDRCRCCEGTGNMLCSMYFQCLACEGDGHRRGPEIERLADIHFNLRFPGRVSRLHAPSLDWYLRAENNPRDHIFHRGCEGRVMFTGHSLKCQHCKYEQLQVEPPFDVWLTG